MGNDKSALTESIVIPGRSVNKKQNYSYWICLLQHSINGKAKENADQLVIEIVKLKPKIELPDKDIDKPHRLGAQQGGSSESRNHYSEDNIFYVNIFKEKKMKKL